MTDELLNAATAMEKLIDAIRIGDNETAESLIASGLVKLDDPPGPVCVAARRGNVAILTMLLDAGANINCTTGKRIPLREAYRSDHFDAFKFLVERGINISVVASRKESVLAAISNHDDDRMAILLLDAGASLDHVTETDLLDILAFTKSVAVLKRLLARNVNVSALRDEDGDTLCHRVVANYDRDVDFADLVRAVVNVAAVDINATNGEGETALHRAGLFCDATAAQLLVELGADVDQQTPNDETALHIACGSLAGRQGLFAEMLLALGANASLVDRQGRSASHVAAQHALPDALCACLAAGGDLDQPNNAGETPRTLADRTKVALPTAGEIDAVRQRIAKARLDLVRHRAFEVCVGLQPLNLDALQLCEILAHSFGALGSLIAFHQWWAIATTVKHFSRSQIGTN